MQTIQKLLFVLSLLSFLSYNVKSMNLKNDKPFRGFMIDAPRGVETMDYYFRLIDFCRKEELNSIIFRLTDDSGSAYLFTSHPELNMCEGAFTASELRTLIKYAQTRGIQMIPEIESFGHSKYITQTEKFKFLNDGPAGADFNALCPVNGATLSLMKDLFTEVAAIFPSQYLHIGCDEVNWGASEMSKQALATKSRHQIWAEYVNKLNGCVKSLGKKIIIWGDVPIYHEKDVLDLLNRDIVIMDWNYWETDKAKIEGVANTVLNKGFKLIACPAVSWCAWGPRVGELQFKNINAYAEVYGKLNNPNNLGIILSNWVPKRYLQNCQWDTYTIASKIIKNNGNYNYMDAIPAFVKEHFGANYDANWEKIFRTVYEETPQAGCGSNANLKFSPWASEKDIMDIMLKARKLPGHFSELINLLTPCRGQVIRNMGDFDDFLLTLKFMEYNYNRQNELLAFINSGKVDLNAVETYLKKVAREDQNQLSKIYSAWNSGRRINPNEIVKDCMWSFYIASDYSKHLSENPSEFIKILKERN
ncbi:MAG: family 20 glycosylhydrolase [Lentimicrobiaceae bacterium]|nr:family 20 glycosylhydrolase [Lentimicrobiaceae bacterium]